MIVTMILYSAIKILLATDDQSLNWLEFITLKLGFSIYAGWATAATILNFTLMFESFGLRDPLVDE